MVLSFSFAFAATTHCPNHSNVLSFEFQVLMLCWLFDISTWIQQRHFTLNSFQTEAVKLTRNLSLLPGFPESVNGVTIHSTPQASTPWVTISFFLYFHSYIPFRKTGNICYMQMQSMTSPHKHKHLCIYLPG